MGSLLPLTTFPNSAPLSSSRGPLQRWVEQASTHPAQIRHWWQHQPYANVGIATGCASGLVVVDVDPRHGGHIAWEELVAHYGALPTSPQVLTGGGGTHDYLWCAEARAGIDLAHGIQFQAEGRLGVAPPSRHISGRRYTWEASHDLDDIPMAPLPAWIRARVRLHQQSDGVPEGDLLPVVDAPPVHRLQVSPRIQHLIVWGVDPGQPTRYPSRSEAVFAVIQALLHARVDHATIAAVLLHPAYRISDKPRSQRDPRSPRYATAIREWVAKEIRRAQTKMSERPLRKSSISARTRALLTGRLGRAFFSKSRATSGVMRINSALMSSGGDAGCVTTPFMGGVSVGRDAVCSINTSRTHL